MEPRPLPLIIAILILLVAGGALWFVLTRGSAEVPGPSATSTPDGTPREKGHIEDAGQYHQIDAYYPGETPLRAFAGAGADTHAVAVMKLFAEQETARFKDNTVAALTAEDIEIQGLGGDRKYVLDMDYDLHSSAATVSYVYHMYADTLGAHPNAYYRSFTFDKKTGEGLLIDDIFSPTADYLEVLSNESRTRLPGVIRAYSGSDPDPDMLEAGTTPYPDNFQTFYLEGKDLVLIFPPYQIGPWAIGTQELHIPRAELGNALKAEYR